MPEQTPDDAPVEDGAEAVPAPEQAAEPHARRNKILRRTALGLVLLLVVLAGGGWWLYRDLEGNLEVVDPLPYDVERPTRVEVEGPKQPVNLLLIGSDTRAGQSGFDSNPGGDLSDTTILLHLSASRTRAYGVSIPRDLIVDRPECPSDTGSGRVPPASAVMFNTAYGVGKEGCTILTVEKLTNIRIDDVVVVKFDAFKEVVDAIGGVPVCVPKAVDTYDTQLPAGSFTAKGDRALDYVRVRVGLGDGSDVGRMKRQQAFLAAMTNKVVSLGVLGNPFKLYSFLDAATASLIVSEGLSDLGDLAGLGRDLRTIGLDRVKFLTMPIAPYAPDPNRLAVGPGADDIWQRLRNDEPLTDEQVAGSTSAEQTPEADPTEEESTTGRGVVTSSYGVANQDLDAAEAERYGLCAPGAGG